MVYITIVGAGAYGKRIAGKYRKFETAEIKAVISRREPDPEAFSSTPFFTSAVAWKKKFGIPSSDDVFDICVHHHLLINLLEDFVAIGAKNFILPKPIALNNKELLQLEKLVERNKLKIFIASQWHYSSLVKEIKDFVKEHKKDISSVNVVFSRSFEEARKNSFTSKTAFLPHILQILINTKLIKGKEDFAIESSSEKKIKITYKGKIKVHIESDIIAKEKEETLKIFLKGDTKPKLSVSFSGIFGPNGYVVFPTIAIDGKKHEVKEDILEKMTKSALDYFGTGYTNSETLTLGKYLPVAVEVTRVVEQTDKLVIVIGGGIFGTLSALEIAKKGYPVLLIEKSSQLITGASLVNQCRVHMGYHYPRDEKTAIDSLHAKILFDKVFEKAIIKSVENHYLIARNGSLTTPEDFLVFCKKLNLPHKESWPRNSNISKDKIALSLKVPEPIFDANVIREILYKKIEEAPLVALSLLSKVTAIQQGADGYDITYESGSKIETVHCAAVVNATYSNLNEINKLAGIPVEAYQYELCEVLVARTPWKNTGWAIMDGPFFGIMPFGFSKNHLLYDVELSVLERMTGELPKFKFNIEHYDDAKRRAKRFDAYKEKWGSYIPEIEKCRHLSSMYIVRMVLPKKEKTDSRPTMLEELRPGFWQMFSGKITTSVPQAIELSTEIDRFLKKKKIIKGVKVV